MKGQFLKQSSFLSFLRSNTLEQLEFKLEKIIGILKPTGKIRKKMLKLHIKYFELKLQIKIFFNPKLLILFFRFKNASYCQEDTNSRPVF